MGDEMKANDITRRTVVYRIPAMEAVRVCPDVEYSSSESGPLTLDVYRPSGARSEARLPAVLFVAGYPDPGFERMLGCKFKEMGSSVSWARLVAASGMAAITYTNRDPASDLEALLRFVRENAASLGIDERRIGLWAASGNVPAAVSALMQGSRGIACAAWLYGYILDLEGSTAVAGAAAIFKFANPCAGRLIDEFLPDVPFFIARAGRDGTPGLNESLDRFVAAALARNLPMTLVNHVEAPHAFDLFDDSETTRSVIRQILAFLRNHLGAE